MPSAKKIAAPRHWLVKTEPSSYSWDDFVCEGRTKWTGVRNFAARVHLNAMKLGDTVFFYHSVVGKEIVGIAEVAREAYPDPTAKEEGWVCVDLVPVRPVENPIPLALIKTIPLLANLPLLRQSRLSVSPVGANEFREILRLAKAARTQK